MQLKRSITRTAAHSGLLFGWLTEEICFAPITGLEGVWFYKIVGGEWMMEFKAPTTRILGI
jgi:hypothetical protein